MTPTRETDATAPKRIRRFQIGVNVLLQIIFILFLAIAANYLGFSHYKRWDMSREQKYALSDKTKRFLSTLKNKMRVTVFFASTPITPDVQSLLTEYQYAGKGKIDIENIDPERNLSRAKELFEKYKVVSDESLLVLDYEGRNKTVKASEMAEIDQGAAMFGEGPHVSAFKGEQAITGAMMDLVERKKNTVGYVTGHKEPSIVDAKPPPMLAQQQEPPPASPISTLKTFIENENIKFQELNLQSEAEIPADIKTIVLAGPQYDLSDREMKLLRDFWEKQGRVLLLVDPGAKTPKLTAFLNELGLRVNDDRLMVFIKTGIQEVAITRDVQAHFLGESAVTKRLAGARALFFGGSSSLTLEPQRVQAANIKLEPLIQAEKGYFAEKDYNGDNQAKFQEDARTAPQTPLTIAAAIEKGGSGDARVQVGSSRMVVVTNATFIQDKALTQDQQGLDFISGAINWLLSREQLIGIAPKVPKTLTFSLDEDAMRGVRWLILVLIPLVPAVLGAAVWWQRRA
ncbi:MAG: GldG family protein [Spartobacteria bacterium]